jgi:hypothetical protein
MQLKKIVILSLAVCLGLGLFAQRSSRSPIPNWSYQDMKSYNFGFLLGANQMDFRVKMRENFTDNDTLFGIETGRAIGFTVGAIANKKLHEFWDLRSGVFFSFGARALIYSLQETPNKITQMTKEIEATTLDIPLEIKWRGMRDRSLRPYVIGGFRYSLDMASNARKRQQQNDEFDVIVKLKRDDFLVTTGAGFDFYLPHGNRIGIEIKMAFGMRDLLVYENNVFTNGIDRLTSRNLQITINIE